MPTKQEQLDKELAEVKDLLERQDKEARAFDNHKKGSKRRAQAKRRLLRLKGLIKGSWAQIRRLRKTIAEHQDPGQEILDFFKRKEGISEKPAGSNCGGDITRWEHFTGYTWACAGGSGGVYWCGCIACFALVAIGKAKIPSKIRIGFNGYINDDAIHHRNGLRKIDPGHASLGCLATMRYPHIVTILSRPDRNGRVITGEGNTSPDSSGSQYNGGCVAIKSHHISEFTVVAEVAGIHFDK